MLQRTELILDPVLTQDARNKVGAKLLENKNYPSKTAQFLSEFIKEWKCTQKHE